MAVMSAWGFCKALVDAGVCTEAEIRGASRIVIDCDCQDGHAVQVYVQRIGGADALKRLAPMMKGMLDGE